MNDLSRRFWIIGAFVSRSGWKPSNLGDGAKHLICLIEWSINKPVKHLPEDRSSSGLLMLWKMDVFHSKAFKLLWLARESELRASPQRSKHHSHADAPALINAANPPVWLKNKYNILQFYNRRCQDLENTLSSIRLWCFSAYCMFPSVRAEVHLYKS